MCATLLVAWQKRARRGGLIARLASSPPPNRSPDDNCYFCLRMSICKHILTKIKAFKSIHLMKTDLSGASCFRGGGWRCVRDGRELPESEQDVSCWDARENACAMCAASSHHRELFRQQSRRYRAESLSRNTSYRTPSQGRANNVFVIPRRKKNFSFLSAHPSNGVELSTIQVTLSVDPSES